MKEREKVYGGNLKTVVTHKLALAGDKYTWHLLEIFVERNTMSKSYESHF